MREFFEQEWKDLGERLRRTAEHFGVLNANSPKNSSAAVEAFLSREAPNRYDELLDRYRDAAQLAVEWQDLANGD